MCFLCNIKLLFIKYRAHHVLQFRQNPERPLSSSSDDPKDDALSQDFEVKLRMGRPLISELFYQSVFRSMAWTWKSSQC